MAKKRSPKSPEARAAGAAKKKPVVISPEASDMGKRLSKLITDNGMTQAKFAAKLDVSIDTVKKMVSGETLTTYVKLPELAKSLNSTPNDLFGIPSGLEDGVFLSAIEAYGLLLDARPEEAQKYAQTVLKVLRSRQVPLTVTMDRQTWVRILLEREFDGELPKARPGSPAKN